MSSSQTERANLLIVGFLVTTISLANLLIIWIHELVDPPPFRIFVFANASLFSFGHLLALLVAPVIFFTKRHLLGFGYLVVCLIPFGYEFSRAYRILYHDPDLRRQTSVIQLIYLIGNPLDFVVPILLLVLAFWCLSLVIRRYVTIDPIQ